MGDHFGLLLERISAVCRRGAPVDAKFRIFVVGLGVSKALRVVRDLAAHSKTAAADTAVRVVIYGAERFFDKAIDDIRASVVEIKAQKLVALGAVFGICLVDELV